MSTIPALPSGLPFAKGHGTGNDFILVSDPTGERDFTPEQVASLCHRHRGIGGDGLIVAVHSSTLPEGRAILQSCPDAQWFMDYRNADGSVSEMCGNGVRVFVHFLLAEGLLELDGAATVRIGTRAGLKTVSRSADGYAVDMGPWWFEFPDLAASRASDSLVDTVGLSVNRPALSVNMGNPHTVVALADAAELQAVALTAQPQVLPAPPNGTNVEYVVPAEPLVEHGVGRVAMRVYERGVGETLSCGTGACAAAVATRYWAGSGAPDAWWVEVPGGVLGVRFNPGPDGRERVELSGPAVIVARGVLN
ncbi:diaminopimelate epimerase [Arthrobacter roseus]|uniref:diaminopimelate epimerase n=1 Tax=Arthrobacter roseus TaxID=136274 RepID=UPI001964948C|nr:diaminopimelate epimerase [Arthrobacter roseus]